jgi:hypothetical protein
MDKHEIIQSCIDVEGFTRYLEIGYQAGVNFNKIRCEHKVGVDPTLKFGALRNGIILVKATSDEFFEKNEDIFDCIFIDGDHSAAQVARDIENASKCLLVKGVIFVHDTYPTSAAMCKVPRIQRVWTGDGYRVIAGLVQEFLDKVVTFDIQYGLTKISPGGRIFQDIEIPDLSFSDFSKDVNSYLNLRSLPT